MSSITVQNRFLNLYPVWILLSSVIAFLYPPAFKWFTGNFMVMGLSLVMLGMGFTLTVNDFREIVRSPGIVLLGFAIMYTIMPLTGWGIARLFKLEAGLAVGLILVGCCPGGTASNIIAYIAKANIALSVTLTTVSTLGGIIVKPFLCQLLAGKYIPIDAWGIFLTMLQVILLPVGIGVFCNYKFPRTVHKISSAGPFVSVIAIVFIAGGIMAQSAKAIAGNALTLFAATFLLHCTGFAVGYLIPKLLKYDKSVRKTISIETGMQNGGLAAVLAKANFPMQPLTAVPAIFCSVVQTMVGGILGSYWRITSNAANKQEQMAEDHSAKTNAALLSPEAL